MLAVLSVAAPGWALAELEYDVNSAMLKDSMLQLKQTQRERDLVTPTPEEFQKIRAHPKVGADIVSSVPFPYPVAPLILSHHERWDGKGYPDGLAGEQVPLAARIVFVCDAFNAMRTDRVYRAGMSQEAAVKELLENSGTQFDPIVVAALVAAVEAGDLDPTTPVDGVRALLAGAPQLSESVSASA